MTDVELSAAGRPGRVGQATSIEQSRAVAQVQAAMVMARQFPRNEVRAQQLMRESCARPYIAERAFYRMPRSGGTVSGPSIVLAVELARLWGNIDYGIAELDRDQTTGGRSELIAYAWDLETNTRVSTSFIVPHQRDKGSGADAKIVDLGTLQAVYESNANAGARRVREQIMRLLPPWFKEEAQDLCRAALERGDGSPLTKRVAATIAAFDGLGIREDRLAAKLGKPSGRWTGYDLADLQVIGSAIRRGETTADEEFPRPGLTPDDLGPPPAAPPAAVDNPPPAVDNPAPAVEDTPGPEPVRGTVAAVLALLGVYDAADRLLAVAGILRQPIDDLRKLSGSERDYVITGLQTIAGIPDEQDRAVDVRRLIDEGREINDNGGSPG